MLHKNIPLGDIHYVHNWEVANAAGLAALVLTEADRGKLAWKLDTNEFFFLANHIGPVWVGTLGAGGSSGPPGLSILNGVIPPVGGLGAEGEFYIDTATSMIYGPKTVGGWPAGVSLMGATGPAGEDGIIGVDGADGLGVPAGGTIGQVLTKLSAADNDTEWADSAASGGREILSAARTYYVRTDGSDSNDGLTNDAGGAFLTAQKAIDTVCDTLDMGSYQVTIQLGDGTYTSAMVGSTYVGKLAPIIQGNLTTPANVLVSTTSANCFTVAKPCLWLIRDIKLQTATSGTGLIASGGGQILFQNVNFGACASSHISINTYGSITATGNYAISGSSPFHIAIANGGSFLADSRTVTITGTPAFSSAFCYLRTLGIYSAMSAVFSGSATGPRYNINLCSVIFTNGAGTSFLPGSSAGVTATGGQYA